MAKLIELCGAPGVGKSTIYQEMVSKWKKKHHWIPAHFLYPRVNVDYGNFKNIVTTFTKKIYGKTDSIAMKNAGSRFTAQHPDYIESCWNHIFLKEKQSFNGTDQRFEKSVYMFKLFQKVQVCLESGNEKIAVMDEGLINGIGNALFQSENETEEGAEIANLLNKIPLPDAIVYIDTDIEENIKRYVSRKKVLPSIQSLDKVDLVEVLSSLRKTRKTATRLLEDRNIPVLYINSIDSIQTNASKIISFAETLYSNEAGSLYSPVCLV